jgi:H+-translocating NAD(P) transhydrogenase subunit beta
MSEFLPTSIQLSYLVASALFIVGLKQLGSPATARQGNVLGAIGMLIAIVATLLDRQVLNYEMIAVGITIGSILGAVMAYKVEMTSMPQMVGLLNGFGGAASALVAVGEFWRVIHTMDAVPLDETVTIVLSILIGGVTFTGSLLAFAKLQELVPGAPITFPLQQPINLAIVVSSR